MPVGISEVGHAASGYGHLPWLHSGACPRCSRERVSTEVNTTSYSVTRHTMLVKLVSRTGAVGSDRCSPKRVQVMSALVELETPMNLVLRTYSGKGSTELFSLLEKNKADIEKTMRTVKGFESYTLARHSDGEGGLSMTVCQDKAGTEESASVAKEWISRNAANISVDAPKVSAGSVIIHAAKLH